MPALPTKVKSENLHQSNLILVLEPCTQKCPSLVQVCLKGREGRHVCAVFAPMWPQQGCRRGLCMTLECGLTVWIHVRRWVCDGCCIAAPRLTWQAEWNHMCICERSLTCVYGEACVRLMRCFPYIANMAHFYDTDGPCFPPVPPSRLIMKSSVSY